MTLMKIISEDNKMIAKNLIRLLVFIITIVYMILITLLALFINGLLYFLIFLAIPVLMGLALGLIFEELWR